jgi:subtilase family serine protease
LTFFVIVDYHGDTAQMKSKNFFILFCLTFLLLSLFSIIHTGVTEAKSKTLRSIILRQFRSVCDIQRKGNARCLAHVVTNTSGTPLVTNASPLSSSYGPTQFHTAYNLPCSPGGSQQSVCATPSSFGGQTIALITAYNDQHIANDLNIYTSYYGLPSCTATNGCLTIVNQNGGSNLPTLSNSGWALEASLDVETAHMVCQTCKILLIEANDSSYSNLGTAVTTAARLGATEISNSYGGSEWSNETSYNSYYSHPGIAITVSSGDSGYGAAFPASSPNVTAVGGTTLQIDTDNTYANENVWSGTGSGCSLYEIANTWQKNLPNWAQTNCGTKRAVTDVAADADPDTGAAVYDSTPYDGQSGWFQIGGTSLSSPLIAGMYALADGVPVNTNASSTPYSLFSSITSHDITQGNNGICGTIMCTAGIGYDGPSGMGSPNGIGGFTQNFVLPTLTPTVTPTPTLSIIPTLTATPTPTQGATSTPTPTLTQTPAQTLTFGFQSIGNFNDIQDSNYIDGSRFQTGSAKGTLTSMTAYVGNIQSSPNNQYQLAIYTDTNGAPGTLLAKSTTGKLTANSWNTLSISASLNANTFYWLMYNTNATNITLNNLRLTTTSTQIGAYSTSSVAFETWPTTFTSRRIGYEYSIYGTYTSQ